jgi:hypothetical protein
VTKATLSLVRQSNIDTFIAVFIGSNHLFLIGEYSTLQVLMQ